MQALATPSSTPSKPHQPPELEQLGERIAELSAQITAATYQLLTLIAEFDEREGWAVGFKTCAHWLSWRTGLAIGPAREKVRVARALRELPVISESMGRGEISYSKVRALTRVATPENEGELLAFARAGTASHVERLVRAWRRVDSAEEREREAMRHAGRHLTFWTDEDGMVVVRGRLEPEAGAALMKAVEAAEEVLFGEEKEAPAEGGAPIAQRRADAVGRVAEAALSGGLDKGTRGDRYQVVVHVDAEALEDCPDVPAGTRRVSEGGEGGEAGAAGAGGAAAGGSVVEGGGDVPAGTRRSSGASVVEGCGNVPAGTSRRIACDASKVVMTHDAEGGILDVGRKTRVISPALRRALTFRDRGCRFPGCASTFCDAHHVQHWADGGETSLENLLLLCRRHHRSVHEEGYQVRAGAGGEFRFFRPDGKAIPEAPPLPDLDDDAVAALARSLVEAGVDLEEMSSYPEWEGGGLDLAYAVDAFRAVGSH